jgi:ABC-type branched-subunit amino acid transport system ATPase component
MSPTETTESSRTTADNLLEVEGLTVRFGGLAALDDVHLVVPRGGFVGLIGPNGAGKTTFMDAVSGLIPSTGSVRFAGQEINARPPHARVRLGLGRTFQSLELFEDLTVRENLLVAAERTRWWSPLRDLFRSRAESDAAAAADAALETVELTAFAGQMPTDLSLGQRKLVSVARGLAARPELLLLDEPAAGLDSEESLALGRQLRAVAAAGTTVLLIDHDMGMVREVCDHIEVLDAGRLIASGDPDAIMSDPKVIAAYLGGGGDTSAEVVEELTAAGDTDGAER